MWCRACSKEVSIAGRVPFRERCPHCDAALHSCVNCRFHDSAAYNSCREPKAERQVEKQRENRCEYFETMTVPPGMTAKKPQTSKDAFEALFAKQDKSEEQE